MSIISKISNFISKRKATTGGFGFSPYSNYESNWSKKKYIKAYQTSPYVYTCVKLRGEKVGQTDFIFLDSKGETIESPEWQKLLDKPNSFMCGSEFFQLFQTYKDLVGSSYILILRTSQKVEELHVLRPDWIKPIISGGELKAYKYNTPWGKEMVFDAKDVIASHYPNPLANNIGISGLSPLSAGALSVDTEEQLAIYQYKTLKNGGKIEGILSYDEELIPSQIKDIQTMFAEQYSGVDNSGKPLVLYGGTKYQNTALTPTELSFIESKKMTRDDILTIYRVPKILISNTDDMNRATADTAQVVFLRDVIKPLVEDLVMKLNMFLLPDDITLSFDDPTPEDKEAINREIEVGANTYTLTLNERRELMGKDPIPDGDKIFMPFNLVEMGQTQQDETPAEK